MAKVIGHQADGIPIYAYNEVPDAPAVSVVRLGPDAPGWPPGGGHAHAHDFLVVTFFERGGGWDRASGPSPRAMSTSSRPARSSA